MICSIEGCEKPHYARGWCNQHYKRWRVHGDPSVVLTSGHQPESPTDRFWAKVDKNGPAPDPGTLAAGKGPCWIWAGAPDKDGYGRIAVEQATRRAHQFSYELLVAPIPEGLEIDHLCRRTLCVNPDHLEPVTGKENTLRGNNLAAQNARKTHCVRGHEFSDANTHVNSRGYRICRTCKRDQMRRIRSAAA